MRKELNMTQINNAVNPVVEFEVDGQKIKLSPTIIKDYITNGQDVSLQEFKMFSELCKARNLNPFLKQAYLVKYGTNPAQILVSKDAFVERANKNPTYNGKENGVITYNEQTGEVKERTGTFFPPTEKLVGGWCKVYRKDREYPEYASVSLGEAMKTTPTWKSMPATMVEKVAKVRALREAFPEDFSGMYIAEEMQDQSTPVEVEPDPLDVAGNSEVIDVKVGNPDPVMTAAAQAVANSRR